jgi:hypothetical protein
MFFMRNPPERGFLTARRLCGLSRINHRQGRDMAKGQPVSRPPLRILIRFWV